MVDLLNLPPELLCQIALHLPLTRDVLNFGLIHPRVRQALSTPALFKARLAFQGWDVSAWQDQDDHSALERWTRIDYIYCRTVQLFDEAAVNSSSSLPTLEVPASETKDVMWGLARPDPGLYINPQGRGRTYPPILDGDHMVNWLRKLSRVLPAFITHHRGDNISRITEPRHHCALWAYARVLLDMYCRLVARRPGFALMPSEYDWFEHACFSLIAFFVQCGESTMISIFQTTSIHQYPTFAGLSALFSWLPSTNTIQNPTEIQQHISRRYFATFLAQVALHWLLLPEEAGAPQTLSPPSFPYINPLSCYDDPFDLGTTTPPMRPWLRNGLAGTPLAGLSSSEIARPWTGYYTIYFTRRDPPMFLELRGTQLPEGDCMHFHGEGHDRGAFSLAGNCDTRTGVVTARKSYIGHSWEWNGMMTPFGMVGTWGIRQYGGWWWIWPQEWSATTTQT